MVKRLAIVGAVIGLLAIGFVAGSMFNRYRTPASPAPTIVPVVATLAPGQSIVTFPEPIEGTPEANPQLTVAAKVRDAATGQPVVATRVILGGKVIGEVQGEAV